MQLVSRVAITMFSVSLAVLLGVLLRTQDGSAHAEVDTSIPAASAVVGPAPAIVEIRFTQEVASDGTVLRVAGPDGGQVDLGDTALDLYDPERKRVTVSLRPHLGPGTYTVRWTSLSAEDGETDSGALTFVVAGDQLAASPAASPHASPVASPLATPSAAG